MADATRVASSSAPSSPSADGTCEHAGRENPHEESERPAVDHPFPHYLVSPAIKGVRWKKEAAGSSLSEGVQHPQMLKKRSASWASGLTAIDDDSSQADEHEEARGSEPADFENRIPLLFEFSLVEDLATGSSLYRQRSRESAAKMEIRWVRFLQLLIHLAVAPAFLSIPILSSARSKGCLLHLGKHFKILFFSGKALEVLCSILLMTIIACSYWLYYNGKDTYETREVLLLYLIILATYSAIYSPDRLGRYSFDDLEDLMSNVSPNDKKAELDKSGLDGAELDKGDNPSPMSSTDDLTNRKMSESFRFQFQELQEQWNYMQNEMLTVFDSNRKTFTVSLYDLCREVYVARKEQKRKSSQLPFFGAMAFAMTAPTHRLMTLCLGLPNDSTCPRMRFQDLTVPPVELLRAAFGSSTAEVALTVSCTLANFVMGMGILTCTNVAVESYRRLNRRARYLCALLDLRAARRACLPHLSISSVSQVRAWLVLRQYIKKQNSSTFLARSVDFIVTVSFLVCCVLFLHFVVAFFRGGGNAQLLGVSDCQALMLAFILGRDVTRIIQLGARTNNILHDPAVLMNEQLKLHSFASDYPAVKEQAERAVKYLDVVRLAQKDAHSPLHVLGFPFSESLFRLMIGIMISAGGSVLSRIVGFTVPITAWRI